MRFPKLNTTTGSCRISEYDGAYKCWTHNRTWGAVDEPDEPCGGEVMTDEPIKCVSCEPTVRNLWKRITDLESQLAARDQTIVDCGQALSVPRNHELTGLNPECGCSACNLHRRYGAQLAAKDAELADWKERNVLTRCIMVELDRTIGTLQTRLVDAGELHLADEQTVRNLEAQVGRLKGILRQVRFGPGTDTSSLPQRIAAELKEEE